MTTLAEQITTSAERVQQLGNDYDTRFVNAKRLYADAAVDGIAYFRHLGEKPVTIGRRGIDWAGAHVQHQEWRAQLNRLFHLGPLVVAWCETADDRYALAARDYIEDWLDQHPGGPGEWRLLTGDNTLTLSIRQHMVIGRLADFARADCFDEPFLQRLLEATTVQLDFLSDNLASHMNWRIAHADSLLLNGMRLDFLPAAQAWRDLGVRVINDAFQRQLLLDGVHAERNPGYHGWMTRVFSRYLDISTKCPELGLRLNAERVAAMYDYSVAATRPNGQLCAIHDCTGKDDVARAADWDAPRRQFRDAHGLDPALPDPVQIFPDAGQFFLRSDWSEGAEYWTFDASTWGGGHCHLSRNSIQLHAGGRSLLVDPGTLSYENTDPLTFHGKSTVAHNTLTINGLNQSKADPTTRVERAGDLVMIISDYDGGYWPGRYNWDFNEGYGAGIHASHHRSLLWVPGRYGLVIDHFVHDPSHDGLTIEANWQLGHDCQATLIGNAGADIAAPGTGATLRFACAGDQATLTQHCGEMDPPRGWLPGDGTYDAVPQLSLQFPQATEWGHSLVTVIAPHGADGPARFEIVEAVSPDVAGYGKVVIAWAAGEVDTLHWIGRYYKSLDRCDGLQTDASLVWRSQAADGSHIRGYALDCSYLLPYIPSPTADAGTRVF